MVTFSSQVAGGSSSSALPNSSATLSPMSQPKRRAQNGYGLGQSSAPISKQQHASAAAGPPSPGFVVLDLVSDDDDEALKICGKPSSGGRRSAVPVAAQQPKSHPSTVSSPVVVILESQEDDVVLLGSSSPAPRGSGSDIQSVAPSSVPGNASKTLDASQVLHLEQQVG